MTRELILLSPYRLPGQNPLMLGNDDVAAFLNGYTALWHPAVVAGATGPPRIGSPYDYEQPTAGHVYAAPDSPPLLLPDDWEDRVRAAGAVAFRATADREATLENLKQALQAAGGTPPAVDPWSVPPGPFFGVGFGYLVIDTLFEAMEHENLLATAEIWQDVQQAVAALDHPENCRQHLQAAAERLLQAREVLYPVNVHLLDLYLLDERRLGEPWPATFERDFAVNVVASSSLLEKLGQAFPERLAALRERVQRELAEVCGGCYAEFEDALLPVESQLWNLRKGLAVAQELLGSDIRTFARKRFAAHPGLPVLLNAVGLRRMLFVPFDDAVLPTYRVTVVSWSAADGKQIEAFTRAPYQADNPQTFFNLTHYLHKTIMQDHGATLALLHAGAAPAPWYHDLVELSQLGPALGQWTTFSRYMNDVLAGEYISISSADEFHGDYLDERTSARNEQPVSAFARHLRQRRRLDTAWTLAALHRGLAGRRDTLLLDERLRAVEDQAESRRDDPEAELAEVERVAAQALADRLLARASAATPGYLVLNPCNFTRRLALELDGFTEALAPSGPLKACQVDGTTGRLVVEVPALGFAWIPRAGPTAGAGRMTLADARGVRNEFFEAEIDPTTGGLRAIYDHRTRVNRLGQQLVFNPGSSMRASAVRVTSAGPALGEIVSEGTIVDEHEQTLATFRQRFRAWLGRPVLELRLEVYPEHPPQGYPWHSYYGARFAWRDERAVLLRGVAGSGYLTSHTRPESPDYLEIRHGRQCTVIFPGGLPFHQRHGARMLDVILLPEGETARVFDLAVGLDREHPMQTALGMSTPAVVVPTEKGPPHVGPAGWLFHLDVSNLVLTSMRPVADGADAVIARLVETNNHHSQAELRCPRDPLRAVLLDARGEVLLDAATQGDAALFEVAPGDLIHLRVDFE